MKVVFIVFEYHLGLQYNSWLRHPRRFATSIDWPLSQGWVYTAPLWPFIRAVWLRNTCQMGCTLFKGPQTRFMGCSGIGATFLLPKCRQWKPATLSGPLNISHVAASRAKACVFLCVYGGWLLEVSTGNPDRLLERNWRLKKSSPESFYSFPLKMSSDKPEPLCHYL